MQQVDVLAGAQGAGMVNALYLRPGAAAVVLFQFGAASDMFRDVLEVGSEVCGNKKRNKTCRSLLADIPLHVFFSYVSCFGLQGTRWLDARRPSARRRCDQKVARPGLQHTASYPGVVLGVVLITSFR